MNLEPFIPAALRNADLSPHEFRVWCHLWSMKDNKSGVAWPSRKRLCAECRMGNNTLNKILKSLEAKGWLKIQRRRAFRNVNRYIPLYPVVFNQRQLNHGQLSSNEDEQLSPNGTLVVANQRQEGHPNKVNPIRGVKKMPPPINEFFTEDDFYQLAEEFPDRIDVKEITERLIAHYRNKPDKIDLQQLRRWVRTERSPQLRQQTKNQNDAQLPKPENWRQLASELYKNDEGCWKQIEGRSWQGIPITTQEEIIKAESKTK